MEEGKRQLGRIKTLKLPKKNQWSFLRSLAGLATMLSPRASKPRTLRAPKPRTLRAPKPRTLDKLKYPESFSTSRSYDEQEQLRETVLERLLKSSLFTGLLDYKIIEQGFLKNELQFALKFNIILEEMINVVNKDTYSGHFWNIVWQRIPQFSRISLSLFFNKYPFHPFEVKQNQNSRIHKLIAWLKSKQYIKENSNHCTCLENAQKKTVVFLELKKSFDFKGFFEPPKNFESKELNEHVLAVLSDYLSSQKSNQQPATPRDGFLIEGAVASRGSVSNFGAPTISKPLGR